MLWMSAVILYTNISEKYKYSTSFYKYSTYCIWRKNPSCTDFSTWCQQHVGQEVINVYRTSLLHWHDDSKNVAHRNDLWQNNVDKNRITCQKKMHLIIPLTLQQVSQNHYETDIEITGKKGMVVRMAVRTWYWLKKYEHYHTWPTTNNVPVS